MWDTVANIQGWTIVRRKISVPGRIKIAVFITSYLFLYVASVSWKVGGCDVLNNVW